MGKTFSTKFPRGPTAPMGSGVIEGAGAPQATPFPLLICLSGILGTRSPCSGGSRSGCQALGRDEAAWVQLPVASCLMPACGEVWK